MKKDIFKGGLVFGVFLLLITASSASSIKGDVEGNLIHIETEINLEPDSVLENSLDEDFPEIEWSRTYGNFFNSDWFESVDFTSDGGYIAAGTTRTYSSDGYEAGWLVKTDKYGFEEWSKTFGEPGALKIDMFRDVQQTSDGGYVVSGHTHSYDFSDRMRVWLVKTDSNGDEQWNRTYGHGRGYSVQQTMDGGYIIGGDNNGAPGGICSLMIKIDSNGDELWRVKFGEPSEYSFGRSAVQTLDGGFVLTGQIDDELFLLKANGDGNELWNKTYGDGRGMSVRATADGGYIVIGAGIFLLKTDGNGSFEWKVWFGNSPRYNYYGEDVQQTSDGGYILAGYRELIYGILPFMYDSLLIKTDNSGNKEWELKPAGSLIHEELIYSVKQTMDGGYIAAGEKGYTMENALLVKVSPEIQVEITKPKKAFYVMNKKIRDYLFRKPFIIGSIDVEVDVSEVDFEVEGVEFYIDGNWKNTDNSEPYIWKWNNLTVLLHTIETVAYNNDGRRSSKAIQVWKFF